MLPLGEERGRCRPIEVGHMLRQLVAKSASARVISAIRYLQAPLQIGCRILMGCEAVVHAACLYIHNMSPGQMLLKLDLGLHLTV